LARVRRLLRVEDLLLAGWLVLVEPLLLPPDASAGGGGPDLLRATLGTLALAGLAVCIGARAAPGVVSALFRDGQLLWVIGPLIGAIAFALEDTARAFGDPSAGPILTALLVGLVIAARWRLPPLDGLTRRALVTPFILVTSGYFGEFMSGLGDLFDVRELADILATDTTGFGAFAIFLAVSGVLVFYVMLVYAPRQVAEREGGVVAWLVRVALFLASLTLGATWVGLVA
jgi:hypothetical protein